MASRAGHDINYLSRSGLMSFSGKKGTGPSLSGMQIADVAAGSLHVVIGVLAAVVARNKTGEGKYVDVAMTDGSYAFTAMIGAGFLVDGTEPGYEGHILNGGSLYDFYETKDGRHMSVGSLEPKFFASLCQAIGRPDLIEGSVAPKNLDEVKGQVRYIFKSKTQAEWVEIFEQTDACVEPVMTVEEALNDPHAEARGLVQDVGLPGGGSVRQIANPIQFDGKADIAARAGVAGGAHNREVLRELGFSDDEIDEFERTGLFK